MTTKPGAIHRGLSSSTPGQSPVGIGQVRGLGGVGKSLLAEEYALRFAAAYPGGVFRLRATGTTAEAEASYPTELRAIADSLGIRYEGDVPDTALLTAIGFRIGQSDGDAVPAKALWLVDDLPEDIGVEKAKRWLSPSPSAVTLITTRSTRLSELGVTFDLEQLDPDESIALLTRGVLLTDAQRAKAGEACSLLGHLALAVDVAAGLLGCSVKVDPLGDLVERLRAAETSPERDVLEVAAALEDDLPNGHSRSVAATLLASVDTLHEVGMLVLRAASVLASAPIDPAVLGAALAAAEPDEGAVDDRLTLAVDALRARSLARVAVDPDATKPMIGVHGLVARAIRIHRPDPPGTRALIDALASFLADRLSHAPRHADAERARLDSTTLVHAIHLVSGGFKTEELARLGLWLGRTSHDRGDFAGARGHEEAVWEALRRLLGDEHPATLTSRSSFGASLFAAGELEAAREHEMAVWIARRRMCGDDHPDTIQSGKNLEIIDQTIAAAPTGQNDPPASRPVEVALNDLLASLDAEQIAELRAQVVQQLAGRPELEAILRLIDAAE